jgi:hypothetical protein
VPHKQRDGDMSYVAKVTVVRMECSVIRDGLTRITLRSIRATARAKDADACAIQRRYRTYRTLVVVSYSGRISTLRNFTTPAPY